MFEPQNELSSDLEWMLESGQVDRELLAEALVQEHSSELFRSAQLYLRDPALARQAVEGAIGAALVNIYRYQHGLGVKTWLYRFLVAEWRKIKPAQPEEAIDEWTPVDRQKPRLRELGVLVYAAGFSPVEAAKVLGEPEAAIERRIKKLHLNLLLNHGLSAGDSGEERDTLDRRLRAAAQAKVFAWNDPPPSADGLISAALANAERRGGRRSGWLRIQEVGLVAIFITLAAMLIWGGNGLLAADQEELALQLTQTAADAALATSSRPTPDYNAGDDRPRQPYQNRQAVPDPEPEPALSLASDSIMIRSRIERGFYFQRSLWLDADLRLYYPQSTQGSPMEYRVQFWYERRSNRLLILSGPMDAPIHEIDLILDGQVFSAQRSENGRYEYRNLAVGEAWQGYYLIINSYYLFVDLFKEGDRYIPQELSRLLDRSVLVVEQSDEAGRRVATLWLDVNTGLALRQRYYHPEDQSLLLEVDYRDLAVNRRLPDSVFAYDFEWKGAYPANLSLEFESPIDGNGIIETQPQLVEAPPGYNPNAQALYFEIKSVFPPINKPDDVLGFRASVFTNDYFLGNIDFSNPWTLICDRSDDGARLAFADPNRISNLIYWFDLREFDLHSKNVVGRITQFAISPNGTHLAFFAAGQTQGTLYVLDLESGTQRTLFSMADVRSLVWSPDGRSIGFIGRRTSTGYEDRVMVIDVESGYMFFENSVDFNPERSGEWPPVLWGVDFPVEMGDLRACAQPPANR